MYGRWQCVCGVQFSSAHPFRTWWHQWWYAHGNDNYYPLPKGMTAAEYRAQVKRELEEQRERDEAAQHSVNEMLTTARKLHDKYRDLPVSLKMSHETFRQLVVIVNIKPSAEPLSSLYGMPIIFDEEIPCGEVKEQFAVEDCCGECGGLITDETPHGACMDSAAGRASLK